MSARRWFARAVALLAGLAGSGAATVRWLAEPLLARHAESRIGAQIGVPVHIRRARLRLPASVELDEVRSDKGGAERVIVELVPSALLYGDARLRHLVAEQVVAAHRGTAERVELRPASESGDGRERVRVERARHARRPLAADLVLLELDEERQVRALSVQGGSWDGVRGIEGSATHDIDTWTLKVAWPGLKGTLRATSGERLALDADLHLDDAPLPARPLPWLDLSQARASGTLRVDGNLEDATVQVGIDARGVGLDHRALSSEPARGLAGSLSGVVKVARHGRAIETQRLELRSGGAAAAISGHVDRDGATDVSADMGPTRCQEVLTALRPLLPALDGMQVGGELSGHLRVVADAARLADLSIDSEVDVGCFVERDAPAADPGRLRLLAQTASVSDHPVRSLEWVGPRVVRAFLAGEDTKFFRHRGFDPWTIRRALAADLAAGAFVRGASTITQQLARNLYLDGDRNLSRKLEEAIIAWRLEQTEDKRRMLEAWLHLVELGPGVRGVEEGARYWFGREPAELDDDQATRLAALAPAPRRGFDAAWSRRYRELAARMPSTRIDIPPP